MSSDGRAPACANCGAPDAGELVICRFCKQPVSAEVARTAIPCPNPPCRTPNRWGKQKCVQCQSWLVVSCVFCGALSPHSVSNCLSCNEAFAGAAQRKAEREMRQNRQYASHQAGVWGDVASSFVGAAAGAVIGNVIADSFDGDDEVEDYDVDDVDDGGGFDFE